MMLRSEDSGAITIIVAYLVPGTSYVDIKIVHWLDDIISTGALVRSKKQNGPTSCRIYRTYIHTSFILKIPLTVHIIVSSWKLV